MASLLFISKRDTYMPLSFKHNQINTATVVRLSPRVRHAFKLLHYDDKKAMSMLWYITHNELKHTP